MSLQDNYNDIVKRMNEACARVRRDASDVTFLAASKKQTPDAVAEAASAGVMIMGENRVREASQKIPQCPSGLDWHMIGHLQRNKVREAVRVFSMIHSVDSLRLLEEVDKTCKETGSVMPVCLEVNVANEASKFGMAPDVVHEILEASTSLINVDVVGLMTIPPFTTEPEDARPFFRALRELRDKLRCLSGFDLKHLSMGMSSDFEVAIEEGATFVRMGTALFGSR